MSKLEELKKFLEEREGKEVEVKESSYDEDLFETEDGEEYLVLTDEEADLRHRDYIENLIDELGLEAFSKDFREWIIDNAIDKGSIEALYTEDAQSRAWGSSFENLMDDLEAEEIIEEDADEDFIEENEDGFRGMLEQHYYDWYISNGTDFEGLVDFFGVDSEYASKWVTNEASLDIDKISEEIARVDGRGNNLASYDGVEEETGNYFIYRVN